MKIARLVCLLVSMVLFAGCIDVIEHISKEKDGRINIYFKVAAAKSILQMAGGKQADASPNPCEAISNFANNYFLRIEKELPVKLSKIDTEDECGLALELALDMNSTEVKNMAESLKTPIIPIISGNQIILRFPGEARQPENKIGSVLLSSFKYRLSISRSVLESVSKAVFSTPEIDYKPQVVTLPDQIFIEIPISYIFAGSKDSRLIITK
jgi:hypothetical protein